MYIVTVSNFVLWGFTRRSSMPFYITVFLKGSNSFSASSARKRFHLVNINKINEIHFEICRLPPTQTVHEMQFFTNGHDWESEVERCHCNEGWRVCSANENYQLSASLPQAFVVPRSLSDNQILKASKHFMGNRPPVWCWGHINKCVIVRMAVLHTFITDT